MARSKERVVIVGGGVAGLSCAYHARCQGADVVLFEAAPQLGGRCRSYWDQSLQAITDNGSHLILGANPALLDILARVNGPSVGGLTAGHPRFPFYDPTSGQRWTLAPNPGPLPWWMATPERRAPGLGLWDHLRLIGLALASPSQTVAERAKGWRQQHRQLRDLVLDPLCKAILNTPPEQASAQLLGRTLVRILGRGGAACRPYFAPAGLSEDVIAPIERWLRAQSVRLDCSQRVRAITRGGAAVPALVNGTLNLAAQDRLVLALPPRGLAALIPALSEGAAALRYRAITAVHYRLADSIATPDPLLGVVKSPVEWIFCRQHDGATVISVTVSASEAPPPDLAAQLWPTVRAALALTEKTEPMTARVLHHRNATLDQSPQGLRARDHFLTQAQNSGILCCGDWVESPLPNTLEAAVRSGRRAAKRALSPRNLGG
jgi:squalene-associated FAD-dependent desaturase